MEMAEVSKWLGHHSVVVTEKAYAFLEVQNLHAAVAASPKAPQVLDSDVANLLFKDTKTDTVTG